MAFFYLFMLAFVQGVTEFLPISSSAHLILLPALSGAADQGQQIDVALHLGTLAAVMVYFRQDMKQLIYGLRDILRGTWRSPQARLVLLLILATIPALIVGAVLALSGLEAQLRSPALIGWTSILFGILLYWADKRADTEAKPNTEAQETLAHLTAKDALTLGLWQMLALIPGVSRSGITITGARLKGYGRRFSVRLSMLLSVPIILAATGLTTLKMLSQDTPATLWRESLIAAFLAFIIALGALHVMIRFIDKIRFTPYVIYRIALGIFLLFLAYGA